MSVNKITSDGGKNSEENRRWCDSDLERKALLSLSSQG